MRNPTRLMRGFVSLLHTRQTNFTPNRRKNGSNRTARACIRAAVCLTLISQGLFIETTRRAAGQGNGEEYVSGVTINPSNVAVVNFADQAAAEENGGGGPSGPAVIPEPDGPSEPEPENTGAPAGGGGVGFHLEGQDEQISPGPPAQFSTEVTPFAFDDFQAQPDGGVIPPDTHGAVGLNKVMSTLNTNYQVQQKATGVVLSSVTIGGFWSATGASNPYDPKTLYDPYNNRWILTAVSDRGTAASSILVAVSQTPDPNGLYHLARFDADFNNSLYADFPSLGFNKNWITVSVNMHANSTTAFAESRVLAIDYPAARGGVFNSPRFFTGLTQARGGFNIQPAVTYSATEANEYLVAHGGAASATYTFFAMTGTPSNAALRAAVTKPNQLGPWTQPGAADVLPQAPEPNGTGTRKIDSRDSRILSLVYRNGSIYFCQTVGLPAGRQPTTIDRTAAQWVQATASGDFVQGGRVEDPSATQTNGGTWYAFPSLSVNRENSVLMGFSQFSANGFASAAYAFRAASDPAGTMREPVVYKAGEGYYEKTLGGTRNRWGNYSNTQVDPANDRDFWTIQEYAATPVGTGTDSGRWGTWWARAVPPSANGKIAFVTDRDGNSDIYTMEPDGTAQTNRTNHPADDTDPAWSPDGTKIAFTSTRDSDAGEIYVMNADGTNVTRITNNSDYDKEPVWSPDGTKLAFTRMVIPPPPEETCGNNRFCWGDFSGTILHDDIYVMNADGTNEIQLTDSLGYDNFPAWSPDGTKIVYAATNYTFCCNNPMAGCPCMLGANYTVIYVMDADGGYKQALTERVAEENSSQYDHAPAWSPDGTKIIFSRSLLAAWAVNDGPSQGGNQLFIMNPDGSDLERFDESNTFDCDEPAWSPDGAKVTFVSLGDPNTGSYNNDIYVSNRYGAKQTTRLTTHSAGDTKPAWQSR
jgi:Tol biopolymer transport system component